MQKNLLLSATYFIQANEQMQTLVLSGFIILGGLFSQICQMIHERMSYFKIIISLKNTMNTQNKIEVSDPNALLEAQKISKYKPILSWIFRIQLV